jgi:hypothetical protein
MGGNLDNENPRPIFERGQVSHQENRRLCSGEWTLFGQTRRICVRNIHGVGPGFLACLKSTLLIVLVCPGALADELSVTPATMARVGTVDERFQSHNVEMIEVTGGRFWKPYGPNTSDAHSDLYEYRTPIDLTNPRLRRLAAALAPAYMRVGGTWANATYFADSASAPSGPPSGFNGILSQRAVDAALNRATTIDPVQSVQVCTAMCIGQHD